ncbi:tRNA pseudouridine(38-40) synthase TruA [Bacillus massilinigeriensis]|uniref:tRNA pseudouridine(38-40) synthase TruA n=1 Tax=Bacillus mediterraneensis TaxID=1805474 RepID=UPI0008F8D805|nr:tRNA pseudouridine(38-40) synthase TruA [Bacillus mediterraneensis]
MKRIKCIVAYDGTNFAGYQVQPGKRTVQSELEAALVKIHKGHDVRVFASGRTDAGVHAKGQVIHFNTPLGLPEDRWIPALNSLLPPDIAIQHSKAVSPDFHARFDAVGKEYRYFIHRGKTRDPFKRNYSYQFPYPLALERIREAIPFLTGTHDFTSFCSAKTEVEDRVRTLEEIELIEGDDGFVLCFRGNGFLYNMVRILTGTLLEVGSGERAPEELTEVLERRDRSAAGKTAPGNGLYLWEVFY